MVLNRLLKFRKRKGRVGKKGPTSTNALLNERSTENRLAEVERELVRLENKQNVIVADIATICLVVVFTIIILTSLI
jgi:hypothetical protein